MHCTLHRVCDIQYNEQGVKIHCYKNRFLEMWLNSQSKSRKEVKLMVSKSPPLEYFIVSGPCRDELGLTVGS